MCKELGFQLYKVYFFAKAEYIEQQAILSNKLAIKYRDMAIARIFFCTQINQALIIVMPSVVTPSLFALKDDFFQRVKLDEPSFVYNYINI